MLNELFLEHRRQENAKEKKVHVAKNAALARPDSRSSLVRSPARPREFVNSRSKFAELGPPFSVSMALHPFPARSRWTLSFSLSRRSLDDPFRCSISRRVSQKWEASITARSSLQRYLTPSSPAVPCLRSHASHHRRLPREELGRSLPPIRTIMKDINYNFISNYR